MNVRCVKTSGAFAGIYVGPRDFRSGFCWLCADDPFTGFKQPDFCAPCRDCFGRTAAVPSNSRPWSRCSCSWKRPQLQTHTHNMSLSRCNQDATLRVPVGMLTSANCQHALVWWERGQERMESLDYLLVLKCRSIVLVQLERNVDTVETWDD